MKAALSWFLLLLTVSCARVPVTVDGGGRVAYLTTVGGMVERAPDGRVRTDHRESFATGAATAEKAIDWIGIYKALGRVSDYLVSRADTLAAADEASAAAELDTLVESNRSVEALTALELEAAAAP